MHRPERESLLKTACHLKALRYFLIHCFSVKPSAGTQRIVSLYAERRNGIFGLNPLEAKGLTVRKRKAWREAVGTRDLPRDFHPAATGGQLVLV